MDDVEDSDQKKTLAQLDTSVWASIKARIFLLVVLRELFFRFRIGEEKKLKKL